MRQNLSHISGVYILLILLYGCNFNKSVKTDQVTGIKTVGSGLTCPDVYLSMDGEKTGRTTFIYGEKIMLNFNDIQGFTKVGENIFPGLSSFITNESGDTVYRIDDFFLEYTDGVNNLPALLPIIMITTDPAHSNGKYFQSVHIWDKNGTGTFSATVPYRVVENDEISIEINEASCGEIFLFSDDTKQFITSQEITQFDHVSMTFYKLSGFQEVEDDEFIISSRSIAIDNSGDTLTDFDDWNKIICDRNDLTGDLEALILVTIYINSYDFKNPVQFEIFVNDENSDASISARTELTVNNKDPFSSPY